MSAKRKTWQEKLEASKDLPKVCKIDSTKSNRWGTGTVVIPALLEVNALMRRVPRGKLTTIDELRKVLARRHGATIACPITTGIFAWIAAHAAAEAEANSPPNPTPFWRTLKRGGELNAKYPGGIALLKRRLLAEGHTVKRKGERFFVEGFGAVLARLNERATSDRRSSQLDRTAKKQSRRRSSTIAASGS